MKYNLDFDTLDAFYETLYSIPSRLDRHTITPQAVAGKLLTALDNPQTQFRSILITGSKGKGSTALFLSNLIDSASERVGRFSSPHLLDYRERIVVGDDMIKAEELMRLGRRVFEAANALDISHPDEFPRFFEVTTAIAYLYFAERYVDIAVIETGIGALTDATNQHMHEVSILTSVEDEHGDIFGTIEGIAEEKSGVIKANTPLILGDLPDDIDRIILDHAAEAGAPVTRFKRQFLRNNNGFYPLKVGNLLWITDSYIKALNAWIALTAFSKLSLALTDNEKIDALSKTELPARQEVVSLKPFVIIDSAHSGESARRLANYTNKLTHNSTGKKVLLLSFSAKKNIMPVLSAFLDCDKIVLTQASGERSLTPTQIAEQLKTQTKAKIELIDDPLIALEKTTNKLKPNDVLVITGSVYLAGLISQQFRR